MNIGAIYVDASNDTYLSGLKAAVRGLEQPDIMTNFVPVDKTFKYDIESIEYGFKMYAQEGRPTDEMYEKIFQADWLRSGDKSTSATADTLGRDGYWEDKLRSSSRTYSDIKAAIEKNFTGEEYDKQMTALNKTFDSFFDKMSEYATDSVDAKARSTAFHAYCDFAARAAIDAAKSGTDAIVPPLKEFLKDGKWQNMFSDAKKAKELLASSLNLLKTRTKENAVNIIDVFA